MLRKERPGAGEGQGGSGRGGQRGRGGDEGKGPHGNEGPDRYKMREKIVSIGDDYWIETQRGRRAYHVDGKALRIRDTLKFEDAHGRELYEIQTKLIPIKETMAVTKGNREVAVVKKAILSPLRDRLTANVTNGPTLRFAAICWRTNIQWSGAANEWRKCPKSGSRWPTRTPSKSRAAKTMR